MSSRATDLAKKEPNRVEDPEPKNLNLVTALDQLGETPEYIDCPFCRKRTRTKVTKSNSSATNTATGLCCIATGLLGVWMPSVCHWCADIDHHCSECGQHVLHKPHEGPPQPKGPISNPQQGPSQYAPMTEQNSLQPDRRLFDVQGTTSGIASQEEVVMTNSEQKRNEELQI